MSVRDEDREGKTSPRRSPPGTLIRIASRSTTTATGSHRSTLSEIGVNEREVRCLAPDPEKFMRVSYPQHFPAGSLLGPFIGLCEQRRERLADHDAAESD